MNKRLKKKQHRLVSKWLAEHPEYKPTVPIPLPIQTITYQPHELRNRRYVSVETAKAIEEMGDSVAAAVKRRFFREHEDEILSHISVQETTTQEELVFQRHRVFETTLVIVDSKENIYGTGEDR